MMRAEEHADPNIDSDLYALELLAWHLANGWEEMCLTRVADTPASALALT